MVNHRMRAVTDAVSHSLQAPAEVDFFHVCKEICIKPARKLPKVLFDKERSSASPKDAGRGVVLSLVFLQYVQHAAAAERETVIIEESASCTGMFKVVALIVRANFRLSNGHVGLAFHKLYHRCYPVWRHLHIRVQQYEIIGFHCLQYFIVSAGEAKVAFVPNNPDGRINGTHKCDRVVG